MLLWSKSHAPAKLHTRGKREGKEETEPGDCRFPLPNLKRPKPTKAWITRTSQIAAHLCNGKERDLYIVGNQIIAAF